MKHIRSSLSELMDWVRSKRKDYRDPFLDPIPELKDVSDAVKEMQRPASYFRQDRYLRYYERADWYGVAMPLRLFTWRFMRALRARGIPMYVHTAYRDLATQKELQARGFSKLSSGPHQRGSAVDIVHAEYHWDIPEAAWYYIGTLGEQVASQLALGPSFGTRPEDKKPVHVQWGGRFQSIYDPCHWQLDDWKRRPLRIEAEHEKLTMSPYSDKMRGF